jgi:L-alanine-DL-glutamate epimerase-like enolase superfamily enzyme
MSPKPKITSIEIIQYSYELENIGREPTIGIPIYKPGSTMQARGNVLRINTDAGISGEYAGGSPADYAIINGLAFTLIGRDALKREEIYNDLKQATRQQARMGISQIDIALWDLAGKYYNAPVYELLGGSQQKIPCYASTYVGDHEDGGLNTPEAYADFAEECLNRHYPAFKIHGWQDAPISEQIALVHAVGQRVGGKMDLMLDPFCAIKNFGDALKLGLACDDEKFFWYEDPFKDGGVSMHAHRKLRQMIKTPLLQLEHLRGLESHVDFIEAEATDFVRGDPDYDGGITGVMKIAHAAEGFGLDVELHTPGPVRRHLMAAMRNTNYYELGLVHPQASPFHAKIYTGDYSDDLDAIDENGCVDVPEGPGLGVPYNWDYISNHQTGHAEIK